MTGNNKLVI